MEKHYALRAAGKGPTETGNRGKRRLACRDVTSERHMAARCSYWSENYFIPLLLYNTFTPLAAVTIHQSDIQPLHIYILQPPLTKKMGSWAAKSNSHCAILKQLCFLISVIAH